VNLARGMAYVGGRTGEVRAQASGADWLRAVAGKLKSRCNFMGVAYSGGRTDGYKSSRRRAVLWLVIIIIVVSDCFVLEGNDKIDFREFLLLVQNYERPLSEEQEMREMFNAIDTDRNGFIDVDELKSTFSKLGVPLSNTDIRDMLKEANVHGTRIFYEGDRFFVSVSLFC